MAYSNHLLLHCTLSTSVIVVPSYQPGATGVAAAAVAPTWLPGQVSQVTKGFTLMKGQLKIAKDSTPIEGDGFVEKVEPFLKKATVSISEYGVRYPRRLLPSPLSAVPGCLFGSGIHPRVA